MCFLFAKCIYSYVMDDKTKQNRRKQKSASQKELFEDKNLSQRVKGERRHDELARLRKVLAEKRLWWRVFAACLLVNLVFVALGVWGLVQ